MTGYTLATGRAATLIKLAFAAGAKLSAAFIAFGLTALVTRNMPNDEAGLFLLGFSLLVVLSTIFRLGLDNIILRSFGALGIVSETQKLSNVGMVWIGIVVIPFTGLTAIFSDELAIYLFSKPDFGSTLYWIIWALPPMAIFRLLAFAFQGLHRVVLATIFQNLGVSVLFSLIFGYFIWSCECEFSSFVAAKIYTLSAFIIFFVSIILWFGRKSTSFKLQKLKDVELFRSSIDFWGASVMSLCVTWSGVLIAGALVSSHELAYLSAAQRTANLTSFVLLVVNMVVAPRYAKLWVDGDIDKMKFLAKWSTRGMIILVLPVVVCMVVFSDSLMSLFGEGYKEGATLLVIITLGQLINVATGSVGYLLNMTGHERDARKISFIIGPISILCAVVFTSIWGVVGAAIATSVSIAMQNILSLMVVKKRLGFIPFG
jgi:O-antigen/teichoic acid export membrane protein